ncbi:MAG: 1-deoxy-D-xylulose-5-phosphate synthase N-terminal domain-containing protein [bacterium]
MSVGTFNYPAEKLREIARTIRKDVLVETYSAKSGHPGGPLSAADYLTALYFNYLRIDPKNPRVEPRDMFIMSNGHCSALSYALLARRGFFPPAYLLTFRSTGSGLEGHPNRNKTPGIDVSAGSLGHGLSIAHGLAHGAKLRKFDERIYVNCGDGELQEGSCWEAAMSCAHYNIDNIIATVDYNNVQIDGKMTEVMNLRPLDGKFASFGWKVFEADGHDMAEILRTWDEAHASLGKGQPIVILFHTIMMKGVPSYEDDHLWHGKPLATDDLLSTALRELGFSETPSEAVASYGDLNVARGEYHRLMGWPIPRGCGCEK